MKDGIENESNSSKNIKRKKLQRSASGEPISSRKNDDAKKTVFSL